MPRPSEQSEHPDQVTDSPLGTDQPTEGIPLASMGPRFLTGLIYTEIVELESDTPIMIVDGQIRINERRLGEEREKVKKALADSIENGDEAFFFRITSALELTNDEELIELREKLRQAFESKSQNPFELHSINVDLLTNGIAERNLIREGLKPQIARIPFSFEDKNGKELDPEEDIVFVFTRGKKNQYKIVVGSKKGIDKINVPKQLEDSKFQPDFANIDKDPVNNSITIPLKSARDGTESLVSIVEVHKGAIDLIAALQKEEVAEEEEVTSPSRSRRSSSSASSSPAYNPPTPRPPRRSSEGGGYGYVRTSG
ncbi:MAG: hypothetical protein UT12_C0002G0004 [Candidatus Curtissbacteria bacterium GW2011_GWC2_38_9]|uniref:Uncharacterized protein n=3 Tax=Candidatus Curtissiibacteriota TaxID=1752717 RepID=A0A1F5HRQ1_9BACT|nr:MAG: hypothetical protein UT12_C0002G0004 [Candidatus Curtissbacteria bacterium GW2011_GWC2_38_9]KKS04614.1 MAG: hypothetical protein UU56_C0004G0015 [Candidatus Curtissbacteria bacterium GW2011_GWA2_41_24]OGD89724.1 MAG: hypothetical protein A2Z54_01000 [Candidatus Curtissbacteria bacterium RIFCSPHIGHO2_02_39_8]OGE06740.1 MAG: hypothetical protein A2W70_04800 [Candidatus Curtissbacteria bacterium RIFCSPLOWO2_02_41_11]